MPEVAAQLRRARRQLFALAVFLIISFAVGQYMQVRATNQLAAAFDSSRAEFHATRIELRAASAERIESARLLESIRFDLDVLMAANRTRAIENRERFIEIAADLRRRLAELSGVTDSVRAAIPAKKRRQ